MAAIDTCSPDQKYRRRLKGAGRKQVVVDLPNDLVDAIDSRSTGGRRALIVEELVRKALEMEPRGH